MGIEKNASNIPVHSLARFRSLLLALCKVGSSVFRSADEKRRIPHLVKRWALSTGILLVLVQITSASPQVRPGSSSANEQSMPEKYFFKMHESIPCLSGKVTDPNGDHMPWTLVTALPLTSCQVRLEKDPYFDIPWDPTWAPGVPPQLIARHPYSNTAAVVTCTDPKALIKMTLQPAFRVQGKVIDPNGNPAHHYAWAVVLWNHESHGPLPIAAAEIEEGGLFNLAGIPKGLDCVLGIYTKKLGIENIPLDSHTSNAIDVGTLQLAPLEGSRLYHRKETDWQTAYHQMYRLADDEDLKLIKPPFTMARQHYHHHRVEFFQNHPVSTQYSTWSTELKVNFYYASGSPWQSVVWIAEKCMEIRGYEVDLPKEIAKARLSFGDVIWREGISTERKLKALGKLINKELNRNVTFEKQSLQRDVVIVSGRFQYRPTFPSQDANKPLLAKEAESLSTFLEKLAHSFGVPVVNRVESPDAMVPKLLSGRLRRLSARGNPESLVFELGILTRQTNLHFEIVRQPVDTWIALEQQAQ